MQGFKLCLFLEKNKREEWLKILNKCETFKEAFEILKDVLQRVNKKLIIMKR